MENNGEASESEDVRFRVSDAHARDSRELYTCILKNGIDDIFLRQIDNFIQKAKDGQYQISQRLPEEALRGDGSGSSIAYADALFGRIAEASVPAARRDGKREQALIFDKKKELLEQWAKRKGVWFTDLSEFIDDNIKVAEGTDSKVYASKDGVSVIKASRGKKNKRADIDSHILFNIAFPDMAYEFIGYGDLGDGFVTLLKQPAVVFSDDVVSIEDRVDFMSSLGFDPVNNSDNIFTNGKLVAADVQGSNIVRDTDGKIHVLDADMGFYSPTRCPGGKFIPPTVNAEWNGRDITFHVTPAQDAAYQAAYEAGDKENRIFHQGTPIDFMLSGEYDKLYVYENPYYNNDIQWVYDNSEINVNFELSLKEKQELINLVKEAVLNGTITTPKYAIAFLKTARGRRSRQIIGRGIDARVKRRSNGGPDSLYGGRESIGGANNAGSDSIGESKSRVTPAQDGIRWRWIGGLLLSL